MKSIWEHHIKDFGVRVFQVIDPVGGSWGIIERAPFIYEHRTDRVEQHAKCLPD